jgi:predicted GTPase
MRQHITKRALNQENSYLVSLLEKGTHLVSDLGTQFDHETRNISSLMSRLLEGRLHLAVLGQFKRGKSTLLNAFVGEPVLPVSVVPLTSVPTFIRFGEHPMIRVHYAGKQSAEEYTGGSTSEKTAFLIKYVTEEGNPKNELCVKEAEVLLPSPLLSKGVVLIDTPGIGSTFRHNTQATLNFLQQCDAAFFLISADPPISELELDFLKQVRQKVPRLFFVLNKIDYLDADERHQALAFFRRVLAEYLDVGENIPIFCVSSRQGLEAKLENIPERWAESGLEELETHLIEFLANEKFSVLGQAISRKAENIIESVLMRVRISLQALKLPQKTLEEKIKTFEESLRQASRDQVIIQDILEGDKKRVTVYLEDQAHTLREEAAIFLKDTMHKGVSMFSYGKSSKSRIQGAWAESIPVFFEQKQSEVNETVKSKLVDALAPHEQRTDGLIETLRKTAAELFQVPYRPLHSEDALEMARKPYWVLNTWNTEALPMLKSIDSRLDELVRRNVENLRWATLQNINISFARFASKIKTRLEETVTATKGAMEVAHFRKKKHGKTIAEEIKRLEQFADALTKLRGELAQAVPTGKKRKAGVIAPTSREKGMQGLLRDTQAGCG